MSKKSVHCQAERTEFRVIILAKLTLLSNIRYQETMQVTLERGGYYILCIYHEARIVYSANVP